jgi:hypothetical protein
VRIDWHDIHSAILYAHPRRGREWLESKEGRAIKYLCSKAAFFARSVDNSDEHLADLFMAPRLTSDSLSKGPFLSELLAVFWILPPFRDNKAAPGAAYWSSMLLSNGMLVTCNRKDVHAMVVQVAAYMDMIEPGETFSLFVEPNVMVNGVKQHRVGVYLGDYDGWKLVIT